MPILALVSRDVRAAFQQKAAQQGLALALVESAAEVAALVREGKKFSVAILPASLPDSGIWALWGQVRLLNPRPEILIYAPKPDFSMWSGVLEAGGHDVLAEPFSAEQLYDAVTRAEKTFEQRVASGMEQDGA